MENKDLNQTIDQQEIESQEHQIRLEKIKKMEAAGKSPWPTYKPVDCSTQEAMAEFEKTSDGEKVYQLAGRLMTRRDHGKTFFGHIQDRHGQVQVYIRKADIGDQAFEFFKHSIDLGDIVWVKGSLFVTRMGETTINVQEIDLLSKCLHPLPDKFHGLSDVEQRYRQRYLDLISNPESREKFIRRSNIIKTIRNFLQNQDFLEVETPMLHPIPGGAAAKPFTTHHNAYDMELFLRIAPELYLKMLTIGGLERVFEINRNFRNEGVSTKHNPEFTSLEFYMAHGDYNIGMDMTEELFREVAEKACGTLQVPFQDKVLDFSQPFKRLTVKESLVEIAGLSEDEISEQNIDAVFKKHGFDLPAHNVYGVKLFELFEHLVEDKIVQPTFIMGHPIEVSPLSKADAQDPSRAARFELFMCGMELANAFSELNDPFVQAERFKDQVSARDAGDQEAHHYDANYVKALEYALPPTVGVGIGIDRLVMLLTDTTSIKDVILFPTMKKLGGKSQQPALQINQEDKPQRFVATPTLLSNFNNPRIAVTFISGADNKGTADDIQAKINDVCQTIRSTYKKETLSQVPHIAAWRQAYKTFGSKPSEFPSSIESLYKRILQAKDLGSINPLVDIYNYISLKYMLPAGGEDIDTMQGDLQLTYAGDTEEAVTVLGKKTLEAPYSGEVIYKDGIGTICRRWNWREVKRTILKPTTKNAVIVLEALNPVDTKVLKEAQTELAELIKHYCKAKVQTAIVDANNPVFDFGK